MLQLDEYDDFMTDLVTIEPMLSKDEYGAPSFGTAVQYQCRIDGATKQRVTLEGVERTVNAMIYIPGVPGIGPFDRVTLPAGFVPQQPPIMRVNPLTDEGGAHHTEVAV